MWHTLGGGLAADYASLMASRLREEQARNARYLRIGREGRTVPVIG